MNRERLEKIKTVKQEKKMELKDKDVTKLTAKEKDALLLAMARMLGLIE